ncbi:hypothetical protein [Haloarchaeobius sp. DFWS5]|uniref:hypothetical protein n=1 Tax=Haloarchaeobius sp. DFWS5 TaxID=3446114 RepID=UPI003EBF95E0
MARDTHHPPSDSGYVTQQLDGAEQDPDALRDRIADLERDLAARETQVQALRQRYETILDDQTTSDRRHASGPRARPTQDSPVRALVDRVRSILV